MGNESTFKAIAAAEAAYAAYVPKDATSVRKKPLLTLSGPGVQLTKLLLDVAGLSGQRVKKLTVTLDKTIEFEAEYIGTEESAQAALDAYTRGA